jgi:hypothetical protein
MPSPRQRERELISEFGRRGARGFVPPTRAEQPNAEPVERARAELADARWYAPTTDTTSTWTTSATNTTLPAPTWREHFWTEEEVVNLASERVSPARAMQRLSRAIDEQLVALQPGAATSVNSTSTCSPGAADTISLGSSTLRWQDLHLASGAVVNWDRGTDIGQFQELRLRINPTDNHSFITLERDGKSVTQPLKAFGYITFDEMEALGMSAENMTYDQGVTIDHDGERYVFKKEA